MTTRSNKITRWARWLATFIAFPAGGVVARLLVGDIDDLGAAVVGGLAAGLILGAVQAVVGGITRGQRLRWSVASAAGFGAGLAVGASAVGYRTDTSSLVVMGAICGAGVGLAQGLAVPMRTVDRLSWISATPVLWAIGWLITSQVIVDAERHHAVFGSSGALFVSAVAGILVAFRRPLHAVASVTSHTTVLSASAS
jgi:hypothetical protein